MQVHRTAAPQPVDDCSWSFPDPSKPLKRRRGGADPDDETGLVAMGADLSPATLVYAYRHGIFPWPHDEEGPLPWCSPNPRGILGLDKLYLSKTLKQTMRRSGWTSTVDRSFGEVMKRCSVRPGDGTWITPTMQMAYQELHEMGWAHSVEIWDNGLLVGGCYGMLLGGVFTGESMFHSATNASKVALAELTLRLLEAGGAFIDVQLPTEHLESLGVLALHRSLFLELLHECRDDDIRVCTNELPVSRIPEEYAERVATLISSV